MKQVGEQLADREFFKDYQNLHQEALKDIEGQMEQQRVRPSLLSVLGTPAIFSCISSINTQILGEEKAKLVLAGIEKGVQNENDEQIRILNEKNIDDPVVRAQILKMRDESYDFTDRKEIKQNEDNATQDPLYQTAKVATQVLMRFARKV